MRGAGGLEVFGRGRRVQLQSAEAVRRSGTSSGAVGAGCTARHLATARHMRGMRGGLAQEHDEIRDASELSEGRLVVGVPPARLAHGEGRHRLHRQRARRQQPGERRDPSHSAHCILILSVMRAEPSDGLGRLRLRLWAAAREQCEERPDATRLGDRRLRRWMVTREIRNGGGRRHLRRRVDRRVQQLEQLGDTASGTDGFDVL